MANIFARYIDGSSPKGIPVGMVHVTGVTILPFALPMLLETAGWICCYISQKGTPTQNEQRYAAVPSVGVLPHAFPPPFVLSVFFGFAVVSVTNFNCRDTATAVSNAVFLLSIRRPQGLYVARGVIKVCTGRAILQAEL